MVINIIDGRYVDKEYQKLYRKQYYENNKQYFKEYYENNKELITQRQNEYKQNPIVRQRLREYTKQYYHKKKIKLNENKQLVLQPTVENEQPNTSVGIITLINEPVTLSFD